MAGALIAAALGAVAAPSVARQLAGGDDLALRSKFARLDSNHDGRLSFAEYRQARP